MKMRSVVLFVALFVLFAVVFGQTQPTSQTTNHNTIDFKKMAEKINKPITEFESKSTICGASTRTTPASYTQMLILLIVIVIFLYALLYLIGTFFQSSKIMGYLQTERREMIITILFVLFFIAYPLMMERIMGGSLFKDVYGYNLELLRQYSWLGLKLVFYEWAFATISGLTLPLGGVGRVITVQLSAVFKAPFEASILFLRIYLTTYSMWIVHMMLFCVIQKWFFFFFIPVGLVFRTFSPTRSFGNAIVALSLSFLIMYPLMYYIDVAILHHDMVYVQLTKSSFSVGQRLAKDVFGVFWNIGAGVSTAVALFFAFLVGRYLAAFIAPLVIMGFYSLLTTCMHLIVIYGFLLPILNLYITLTFAREIAYWLGTELSLSALVRLI